VTTREPTTTAAVDTCGNRSLRMSKIVLISR
jgi:hypothetical protein